MSRRSRLTYWGRCSHLADPASPLLARDGRGRFPVHAPDRLQQELHIGERVAAGALPVDAALGIDEDRRVELDLFEVVVGGEAAGVLVIAVGEQADRQTTELLGALVL